MLKNKRKGFSLMELIITVAIMAVLAAVLIPSLARYIEESRATKDNYAMQEIVHAVKLALGTDNVYTEVANNIGWNASCYTDTESPSNQHKKYIFVDENNSFNYNDEARLLDESKFYLSGNMYGAVITFTNKNGVFEIKDLTYKGNDEHVISDMSDENLLYHYLRSTVGNSIVLKSKTYVNSDFSIFICFGAETDGENITLTDEAVVVYGQWSGTNILKNQGESSPSVDPSENYGGDDTPENPPVTAVSYDVPTKLWWGENGPVISGVKGDADGDGDVDRGDVVLMLTILSNLSWLDDSSSRAEYVNVCDIDEDGEFTRSDVHALLSQIDNNFGNYEVGDVNHDGVVGNNDLIEIENCYTGQNVIYMSEADCNADGIVDDFDREILYIYLNDDNFSSYDNCLPYYPARGDLNFDHIFDVTDTDMLISLSNEQSTVPCSTVPCLYIGDLNADGVINNNDYDILVEFANYAIEELPYFE